MTMIVEAAFWGLVGAINTTLGFILDVFLTSLE